MWQDFTQKIKALFDQTQQIQSQYLADWQAEFLFSWRWWLKLAMLIVPWVVWFFVRKKESTGRLLLAGFFIALVSIYLDDTLISAGLWFNFGRLNPLTYGSSANNLSMLPVTTMLLIQVLPRMKPVWKALAFAFAGAFVMLPLLTWIGVYQNVRWQFWYSAPILFGMYMAADALTRLRFEPIRPTDGDK